MTAACVPRRVIAMLLGLALLVMAASIANATGTRIYAERGPILGVTGRFVNVEVGTGMSRADVRYETTGEPPVWITSPATSHDLRPGAMVDAVLSSSGRPLVRELVILPISGGPLPWEGTVTGLSVARSRIVALRRDGSVSEIVTTTRGRAHLLTSVGRRVRVSTIRRGSRADLHAGVVVLVIAEKDDYALDGTALAVVIATGGSRFAFERLPSARSASNGAGVRTGTIVRPVGTRSRCRADVLREAASQLSLREQHASLETNGHR